MNAIARGFWLCVQLACGVPLLLWLAIVRRRCPLLFTHQQDRDAQGRDRQMGPLLDALAPDCIEVARVPLSGVTLRRLISSPAFVPYTLILAGARLLAPWSRDRARVASARTRVTIWILRLLRPRVLFLIDESGSGQPLVRAGRQLGIKSVGIQHGDFPPGSALYDGKHAAHVAPVDVLCVWSAWFQARLESISLIYASSNTQVTGRLRHAARLSVPVHAARLRVVVLGESGDAAACEFAPFVAVLQAHPAVELRTQSHPAVATSAGDLAEALAWSDVAIGLRSSALFEAVWARRPVVVVGTAVADSHGLVTTGLAHGCTEPSRIVDACHAACAATQRVAAAREAIWGSAPSDSVGAVLACAPRATK